MNFERMERLDDDLENHLVRELALAQAEQVFEVSLEHGGLRVLGDDLQDLLVDGGLESIGGISFGQNLRTKLNRGQ
jgi:hypothetical protein